METIRYWAPVGAAWNRMKAVLFQPFDLEKWMVMGFVAWFSGLNSGGGSNFNSSNFGDHESGNMGEAVQQVWTQYSTVILAVGGGLLLALIVFGILFSWLGARGRFIFLDNALQNRPAVVQPWKQYRMHGNSLFLWNLAVGCIAIVVLLLICVICIPLIWPMLANQAGIASGVIGIMLGIVLMLIYILFFSYLGVFVYDFIVPIMYKYDIGIRAAWQRFFIILKPRFGAFLLYGLIRYLLEIVIGFALFAAILLTCCCLLLVMAIPYIGTVLLLPVFVFYRFFGIEFLRQFGEEFTVEAPLPETDPLPLLEIDEPV